MDIKITAQRGDDPHEVDPSLLEEQQKDEAEANGVGTGEVGTGEAGAGTRVSITAEDLEEDRYHRLRLINWWNQKRLSNSTLVIAGAGALGNEAIKNLALLGVGRLIVCDFDGIETSNLTRSVLFRERDVGRLKVDVACERAQDINPDTQAIPVHGDLRFVLGYGLVRRADAILGCLDSLEARYYLNHHSMKTGTAYIDAALDHLNGNVMTFLPPAGPCYECQMKSFEKKELKRQQSCLKLSREDIELGKVPTSPTISAIIAGIQSQIAVRHIHKRPIPVGRKIGLYGMTDVTFDIHMGQDPACLTHEYTDPLAGRDIVEWSSAKSSEITVEGVLELMKETLGGPVIWSLDDDREIIIGLSDSESGRKKRILALAGQLSEKDAIDEDSGRVMVPELCSQFDQETPDWLKKKTLSELGIPPLHILYGRNEESGDDAYFELTGDVDLYF